MVHRYVINKRRLLGPNNQLTSGATTTLVNGNETSTNSVTFDQQVYSKRITIPIELKFEPMDNSDKIDSWVNSETQNVINKILDGEKIKYISTNKDLTINFRFLNKNTNTYTTDYSGGGFTLPDEYKLNRFKKSYFRLYFYDSNDGEKSNLLFTEDLPVIENTEAVFPLRRLYWDRDDKIMSNTLTNRVIYMDARFFNAKTGQVHTFYNLPTSNTTPIGITTYSDQNNRSWRTSPITLINPNSRGGEFRFTPNNGVGGTHSHDITLSEFVLT
jgi:hypothetical protein